MTDLQQREQESSVLRWGGISGLSGAVLALLVIIFVSIFLPGEPSILVDWVSRFPSIKTIRIIENFMYLWALIFNDRNFYNPHQSKFYKRGRFRPENPENQPPNVFLFS